MRRTYSVVVRSLFLILLAICAVLAFPTVARSQSQAPKVTVKKVPARQTAEVSGSKLFHSYCASCHGRDGKGNGVAAQALKTSPADLTLLAQHNRGKFPEAKVTNILSNESEYAVHGSKDMPVWGPIFSGLSGHDRSLGLLRAHNVTDYLKSIQVKQPGETASVAGTATPEPAAVHLVASGPPEEGGTVPVNMIVSLEAKHGKRLSAVNRDDVKVVEGRDRARVTEWTPLEGSQGALELFVLVDDAADTRLAAQFDELRRFMQGQPDAVAIGVGYIRNGTVDIVQDLTKDHSQTGKALRLPIGSTAGASPYLSVTELIKRWPESTARREILMISDGVDPLQAGPTDSYLEEAIELAQRAGVQVYSIYATGAGHVGHTYWRRNWGQSDMSQLADETGGEAYFQGFQTPVAYAPFLEQFASRLKHQYRLTFLAKPESRAGFRHVMVETEVPNAELVAADRVYVPTPE